MTCIVGLTKNNVVYMGADSGAAGSESIITVSNPKIFIVGDFIIGASGSFRAIDLLNYSFKIPQKPQSVTDDAFMRTTFVTTLRKTFEVNGFSQDTDDENEIMIGHNGRLYVVQNDFSVLNATSYISIGSGSSFAFGSLFTSDHIDDPVERVRLALGASAAFDPSVCGPFVIKAK